MELAYVNILMAVPISVKRNIAQSPGEKGEGNRYSIQKIPLADGFRQGDKRGDRLVEFKEQGSKLGPGDGIEGLEGVCAAIALDDTQGGEDLHMV